MRVDESHLNHYKLKNESLILKVLRNIFIIYGNKVLSVGNATDILLNFIPIYVFCSVASFVPLNDHPFKCLRFLNKKSDINYKEFKKGGRDMFLPSNPKV